MPRITRSEDLRRGLEHLALAFADRLVDTVVGASFEDVGSLVGGPSRARNPRSPARRTRAATSPMPRADVLASIVSHLRARPAGARAEELRRDLGLDKPSFVRAMSDGLATEEIRKTGRLRATTYFAA